MKLPDHYTVEVECENCRAPNHVSIPRGTTVSSFMGGRYLSCETCGCKKLDPDTARALLTFG